MLEEGVDISGSVCHMTSRWMQRGMCTSYVEPCCNILQELLISYYVFPVKLGLKK